MTTDTRHDPLAELSAQGVAVWLDDLSRELLASGELQSLITGRHVVGVTTNPTIFAACCQGGSDWTKAAPIALLWAASNVVRAGAVVMPFLRRAARRRPCRVVSQLTTAKKALRAAQAQPPARTTHYHQGLTELVRAVRTYER
jgi:hypothetical protein